MKIENIITGALFDLMGFLTSRDEQIVLSATDHAGPAVTALEAFAAKRNLSLDDADVPNWRTKMDDQVVTDTGLPELRDWLKAASLSGQPLNLSSAAAGALHCAMTTPPAGLPAMAGIMTEEGLQQLKAEAREKAADGANWSMDVGCMFVIAMIERIESLSAVQEGGARHERLFLAACADLGAVSEVLGLDPDDGGADPIIEAINELRTTAPEGWKLVPLEPTPEIIAGAAVAAWPTASPADIALARLAAPIVLMQMDAPGITTDALAGMLATMAPAYRAMLAAAPAAGTPP